jgi:hypothetical protein
MLTIRDSQMNTLAAANGGQAAVSCDASWIEVRLVDGDRKPVAGQKYRIKLPDSSIKEGTLDEDGKARFDGIPPGQCQVCFPEIHGPEWTPL